MLNKNIKRTIYKRHPDVDERIQSALIAIKAILPLALYPAHKRELLSTCLWKLTEAEAYNKYGLRYQTPAALEVPKQEKQHEHVFERKKVIEALIANPDRFEEILSNVVACTVTKEEHRRLTKLSYLHPELEGWKRYRAAGLSVLDLATGEKKIAV